MSDLHTQNREVLFTNESFTLGILQAVSAAVIAGTLSQFESIIKVSGLLGTKLLITLSMVSLILAVIGAFAKHQYKMWDVKAACVIGNERDNRLIKTNNWLRTMRACMLFSTVSLCLGLILLVIGLWS